MVRDSVDLKREGKQNSVVEATIIQEADHPIRSGDIDREALKVLYRLRDAGFSGYLVGGGVRDLYLGKRPRDFDISTNARPGQLRRLFRNSRTIGRRFRLVQVFFHGNKIVEVSTLRSQSEYDIRDTKVLPNNNTFGSLEEDAFRRDLTINSLFYEIERKTIIDYVGGVDDLNDKIVRIVGDPEVRITRDPVRMLRAVRHAARTGFLIDSRSWRAIAAHRDKLNLCPSSRIRDEIIKDLVSGYSGPWAELCIRSRVFFTLFPFYDQAGADENGLGELGAILAVIDRLHKSGGDRSVHLPNYMLMALLLYPWLQNELNLLQRDVKGGGYRLLFNDIRQALDASICGRLNIKRSAKETMTTLFVNMPNFSRYQENMDWPKWLKRKSYFKDCARFSAVIAEARGGAAVSADLFAEAARPDEVRCINRHGGGGRGGRGGNPSFTVKEGGVFGLRPGRAPVV